MLRDALISAANLMNLKRQEVDALNVFPVPDGDTGTNMSMTLSAASRELALINEGDSISHVAQTAASALLRGARGNSGVILSLIFRGMAKALKDVKEIDGNAIALALQSGTESAYKAVMKPTEGTILTVIRLASLGAKQAAENTDDALAVWEAACREAKAALADTPNLLPILKKPEWLMPAGKVLFIFLKECRKFLRVKAWLKPQRTVFNHLKKASPFPRLPTQPMRILLFHIAPNLLLNARVTKTR